MSTPTHMLPSLRGAEFTRVAALLVALLASYSFARPSAESLFLATHGASQLPWAWLAVAATTVLVASAYNRYFARMALPRRLAATSLVSAVVLAAGWPAVHLGLPGAAFACYVAKDVYIVVLLEVFWSLANATHTTRSAQRTYGFFMVFGTVGSLLGNQLVGPLAEAMGSEAALGAASALLVVTAWLAGGVAAPSGPAELTAARGPASWGEGMRVVAGSRSLVELVVIVVLAQLVTNLADYLYNAYLQAAYPNTDARTAVGGQVYSAIDVVSLACQMASPLVLRVLGVGGTLVAVPLLVGVSLAALVAWPSFAVSAMVKVLGKSLDYSLFRAGKEMLYIPMGYREKTAGKAVVDMMTYRAAKAGASLALLGVATFGSMGSVLALCGALVAGWLATTGAVVRRYARRIANE